MKKARRKHIRLDRDSVCTGEVNIKTAVRKKKKKKKKKNCSENPFPTITGMDLKDKDYEEMGCSILYLGVQRVPCLVCSTPA